MTILLDNATVVTMDGRRPVLEGQSLLIDQGVIAAIGADLKPERLGGAERIDCSGRIVMPGLVNTHSHLTEILQRSFRDNARMETWREYRMRTEEIADLSPEEVGLAARLACAEMLKSGVTAVVDHFSTRTGIGLDKVKASFQAFVQTGIRAVLAPSLRDRDFLRVLESRSPIGTSPDPAQGRWRDNFLALLEHVEKFPKTVSLMPGPSNPLNCSDSLLREVSEVAERYDLGIHTHLLETRLQYWGAKKLYRGGLVAHLNRIGFLSPRLSAAHGVWLEEREMELLASAGVSVVHNPASNLKLGSGIARVGELRRRGVNVALGTDGGDTSDSYSIFEQMRLAAFLSRVGKEDSGEWVTAGEALRMGTVNGAEAVPAWRGRIGRVRVGSRADLVILRPRIGLYPLNDVMQQLVFCGGGDSVDTVLVDGEIVVRGGRLVRVDEEALIEEVRPISERMWKIYSRIRKRPNKVISNIQKLYAKVRRKA